MSDEERRYRALEMAVEYGKAQPGLYAAKDVISAAKNFYKFLSGSSVRPHSSEDDPE